MTNITNLGYHVQSMGGGTGSTLPGMFTCVQAIKNLMKNYNARGEWVEPTTGLTGLLVTDETGDKQMDKDDRLPAGWTLGEYRKVYSQAFVSAIKEVDPAWTYGKAIPSGVLEDITRDLVEDNLKKTGSSLARASLNIQI